MLLYLLSAKNGNGTRRPLGYIQRIIAIQYLRYPSESKL